MTAATVSPRRVWAVLKRHGYELRHSPPMLFDMFFWPVIDLVIWGMVTTFIQRADADLPLPIGFLLGGVLLWDLVFRSNLGVGITFLDDTSWSHNVVNLLASPLRPVEYLAGIVGWAFVKLLSGWTVMVILSGILFAFTPFAMGPVLALFALALMLFGVAMAMVVVGVILRLGQGADILAWGLAVLLMPLSAIFYPVDALPGWAQALANGIPAAHVFEAMRTVLAGGAVPWERLWAAFALDAVYLTGGLAFAAAMFGTLRRRGFVTRYMT